MVSKFQVYELIDEQLRKIVIKFFVKPLEVVVKYLRKIKNISLNNV